MCVADTATALCRVDASLCSANDLSISEVILKIIIVGKEQPCPADSGQGENMLVVRTTDSLGAKRLGFRIHLIITDLPGETELLSISKPIHKVAVLDQFPEKFTANNKLLPLRYYLTQQECTSF